MIKIKVSYTSENELAAFLRHVGIKYPNMEWKRSENRKGRYRKAYIDVVTQKHRNNPEKWTLPNLSGMVK